MGTMYASLEGRKNENEGNEWIQGSTKFTAGSSQITHKRSKGAQISESQNMALLDTDFFLKTWLFDKQASNGDLHCISNVCFIYKSASRASVEANAFIQQ